MFGYIGRSHLLAKELIKKQDGFVTVTVNGREYIITDIQRKSTHGNIDNEMLYWTLNTVDVGQGNILR